MCPGGLKHDSSVHHISSESNARTRVCSVRPLWIHIPSEKVISHWRLIILTIYSDGLKLRRYENRHFKTTNKFRMGSLAMHLLSLQAVLNSHAYIAIWRHRYMYIQKPCI